MNLIASVAIADALISYDKLYDYIVPETSTAAAKGMRVLVPFGIKNKKQVAWIIDIRRGEAKKGLKEISQIIDDSPLLNEEMIKLAEWMKNRFFCTWGDAFRNMIPSGVNLSCQKIIKLVKKCDADELDGEVSEILDVIGRSKDGLYLQELQKKDISNLDSILNELKSKSYISVEDSFLQRVNEKTQKGVYPVIDDQEFHELIEHGKVKSIYQIRAMELLFIEGICRLQDLILIPGVTHNTIRTLFKKGWVEYTELESERNPFECIVIERTDAPVPTNDQERVLNEIYPLFGSDRLQEILLHGVTGSGKTEIYLRAIEKAINRGEKAIVLVPEISLTPQMTSRFTGRFGNRVAILHSRLSLGERYDQWRKIKNGNVDVVIGARSAVFAPLDNIGIIIVDEEHELTYKSENTPKYDARHIARARCNIHNAVLLLGSATPSVETYYKAKTGKIKLMELHKRANAKPLPQVKTIDMRKELEDGNRSIISRQLMDEILVNKTQNEQSILFLNRRGYSSFLLCGDCGFVLRCPNCSVSLTYHAKDSQSICHYCGYTVPAPQKCPKCSGNRFKGFGTGTQKIEEELKKHPESLNVIRMDLDTTGTKFGHKMVLDAFKNGEADILIGTQMVAKGHDFPNVTLVGILAADASLFTGDYRSSERTFQLITQASGRAGRGSKSGRVIVQAYNLEDYAVTTAISQDYQAFYNEEIRIRKELKNPPFMHIGLIMVSSGDNNSGLESIEKLHEYIEDCYAQEPGIMISEPLKAPVFIIRNKFRWRMIIKHPSVSRLVHIMKYASDGFKKLKIRDAQVTVDIDPGSML